MLSFEGHPLQVRHKQDWDREFIPLLPQTAALPESDTGSGVLVMAELEIKYNLDLLQKKYVKILIYCKKK